MNKYDIRDYIGVLIMVALVIFGMFYVQSHVDSLATKYNQQKHVKNDFKKGK